MTSGGALWSYPSSVISCAPGMAAACSATERRNQAGLLPPPRIRTGAVIFRSSAAGTPARGDGELVGQRAGQWPQGCHPRGVVQLREHLFRRPDYVRHPVRDGFAAATGADQLPDVVGRVGFYCRVRSWGAANVWRVQNAPTQTMSTGPSPARSYAITVPSAEVTVSTGGSPLSQFLAGETSGQCGIHRPPPRARPGHHRCGLPHRGEQGEDIQREPRGGQPC
jgi:hypothetical protein